MFIPIHGLVVVLTGLVFVLRVKHTERLRKNMPTRKRRSLDQDVFARIGRVFPAPETRFPLAD